MKTTFFKTKFERDIFFKVYLQISFLQKINAIINATL